MKAIIHIMTHRIQVLGKQFRKKLRCSGRHLRRLYHYRTPRCNSTRLEMDT